MNSCPPEKESFRDALTQSDPLSLRILVVLVLFVGAEWIVVVAGLVPITGEVRYVIVFPGVPCSAAPVVVDGDVVQGRAREDVFGQHAWRELGLERPYVYG